MANHSNDPYDFLSFGGEGSTKKVPFRNVPLDVSFGHICVSTVLNIQTHPHTCIYIYAYMYATIQLYLYICACIMLHVCMYVWMDGWMHGWMDGCIHIIIHIHAKTCIII